MRMPFGRHRGQELDDLPEQYLEWLLGLDNIYPDLRGAVLRALDDRARRAHQHSAPPPPPPPPPPVPRLDVSVQEFDAITYLAEAGYRALARKHHPDIGGNSDEMTRINMMIAQVRDVVAYLRTVATT